LDPDPVVRGADTDPHQNVTARIPTLTLMYLDPAAAKMTRLTEKGLYVAGFPRSEAAPAGEGGQRRRGCQSFLGKSPGSLLPSQVLAFFLSSQVLTSKPEDWYLAPSQAKS
jgi:hypothetical protein